LRDFDGNAFDHQDDLVILHLNVIDL